MNQGLEKPTEEPKHNHQTGLPVTISKAEINALPLIHWDGPVEILETLDSFGQAAEALQSEALLGFDTESRPSFHREKQYPPAMVQLASAEQVYIFRLSKTTGLGPLKRLFESPDVLKAGVAIRDDVRKLRELEDFKPAGFVEVNDLTRKLGIENRGLRGLAAIMLNGRISKSARLSNWAARNLSEKQIRYAATDAWISRRLYADASSALK